MSSNNFKTDGSEVPRLRKSCSEVPENSEISTAKIKIFLFFALVEIARSGIVSICKQNNSKELGTVYNGHKCKRRCPLFYSKLKTSIPVYSNNNAIEDFHSLEMVWNSNVS